MKCLTCGKEHDGSFGSGKYCCRSCANKRVHTDTTKQKISEGVKNSEKFKINNIIGNKYKNIKYGYNNIHCKNCGCLLSNTKFSRIYCLPECKDQWLTENWKPKLGGYRIGAGFGKSGWYKGIYCDSSWELAFVIYHLDNNLSIKRCKERRYYEYNGKQHFYNPDFVTDEGIIEIKGYKSEQWLVKEQNNPDVKVLYENDIEFYLNYVINKYGKDFINLYDGAID